MAFDVAGSCHVTVQYDLDFTGFKEEICEASLSYKPFST